MVVGFLALLPRQLTATAETRTRAAAVPRRMQPRLPVDAAPHVVGHPIVAMVSPLWRGTGTLQQSKGLRGFKGKGNEVRGREGASFDWALWIGEIGAWRTAIYLPKKAKKKSISQATKWGAGSSRKLGYSR